jgi:hypothetical protein
MTNSVELVTAVAVFPVRIRFDVLYVVVSATPIEIAAHFAEELVAAAAG